jgi:ribosomal protein L37AE/L43A
VLLKIKQDEIVQPEDDSVNSAEDYIESSISETDNIESRINFKPIPQIKELKIQETPDAIMDHSKPLPMERTNREDDSRLVRIGGYFGRLYTVQKKGDKLIYQKVQSSRVFPEKSKNQLERTISKYTSCPECKTPFTSEFRKGDTCPFCGHKLG